MKEMISTKIRNQIDKNPENNIIYLDFDKEFPMKMRSHVIEFLKNEGFMVEQYRYGTRSLPSGLKITLVEEE
jgi:hypothetical protein